MIPLRESGETHRKRSDVSRWVFASQIYVRGWKREGVRLQRILTISDIHGEWEKLEQLLASVAYNPEQDQLVLAGDYIDRGPHSKQVLDKVMQLYEQGAIVLKGNHEDMMVKACTSDEQRLWEKWTTINGGDKTLLSYGIEPVAAIEDRNFADQEELQNHLAFIQKLDSYYETDRYIFVHGGVHPSTELNKTDPYVLLWIRDEFHNGYTGEKTVIFGHTPTANFHGEGCCDVYFGKNNIIGIDGGAVYGGRLNCLELPSKNVYFV